MEIYLGGTTYEKTYIIAASLTACVILYLVEQILAVDYITKPITKLILFIAIPYIYLMFVKKSNIKEALKLRRVDATAFKLGIIFGSASFVVIIAAYFILRGYIDFNGIAQELQSKSRINPSNLFWLVFM